MGGVPSSRSSEPATRPTARRSPHKSPSLTDGGAVGGARWVARRTRCPAHSGRRSRAARGEDDRTVHPLRRPCGRRDTKRSDWRGGRAAADTPRSSAVGVQAARHRAWRVAGVTIWHERSARSGACGALCASIGSVRQAGLSVAYPRRTPGPAILGHGKGRRHDDRRRSRPDLADLAVRHRDAGSAWIAALASEPARPEAAARRRPARQRARRLAVSPREGWPPVRGETLGL